MKACDVIEAWYRSSALGETLVPFTSEDMLTIQRVAEERLGNSVYFIDNLMATQYGMPFRLNTQEYQRERVKFSLETGHDLRPLFGVMGAASWGLVKTDRGWLSVKIGRSSVTLKPDTTYRRDLNDAIEEWIQRQDAEDEST